ncbi:MAG: hypothetical protein JNM93_11420 [Bacteriovoracaceae bacterium]|nr:hypothetical protein [Bacteriovoracaceae bacterium]
MKIDLSTVLGILILSGQAMAEDITLDCRSIKHPATIEISQSHAVTYLENVFELKMQAKIVRHQGNQFNYYYELEDAKLSVIPNNKLSINQAASITIKAQRLFENHGRYQGKYEIAMNSKTQNLGKIRFSKILLENDHDNLFASFVFPIQKYLREMTKENNLKTSVEDLSLQMTCKKQKSLY